MRQSGAGENKRAREKDHDTDTLTSGYRTRGNFRNVGRSTLRTCLRCGVDFSTRLPRHHFESCTAVVAAERYKQQLESNYFNVDQRTTTPPVDYGTSLQTHRLEVSHDITEDQTTGSNATPDADNNDRHRSDAVSTDVAQYMGSLPMIDPEYILKCRLWQPKPTEISNKARLTLKFLSTTCAGNGLSKQHMKGILTFIKSLQGPDPALLPDSIEGCWSKMEVVRTTSRPPLPPNPPHPTPPPCHHPTFTKPYNHVAEMYHFSYVMCNYTDSMT